LNQAYQRKENFMRLPMVVTSGFCGLLLGLPGCASHRPTETHTSQVEQDAVVTVEAIDVPNRLVTVRDASGAVTTVYVDESNKAFPQAAVGDQVRVRFVESLALRLAKPGSTGIGVSVSESTQRPQGGQPTAKTAAQVTATVRIEEVKSNGSVVTFTGPGGRRTLAVQDPAMRDYVRQLRPGDHVEATYSEALALSLEKTKP
jgi:hypothetical protein